MRKSAWIFVLAALAEAVYFFLEYRSLGFPDGHLTSLDRIRQIMYPIFIVLSLMYCVHVYLIQQHRGFFRMLFWLLFLNALFFGWNHYAGMYFENGTGG